MKIDPRKITVCDLVDGYPDDGEGGVVGYGGKLDIRPPYQREFVYKDKEREAVIDSIMNSFPLNVMYWSVRDDDTYEIIDGQQRTISIAQYVKGDFSVDDRFFHNLQDDERKQILDYQLTIYLCSGTDSERLNWFKTINIAGQKLTNQELHNAVYAGTWVTDAKRHFSRHRSPAAGLGGDYLSGEAIRQKHLETVIKWINNGDITGYMAEHQHDGNAKPLWDYFRSVIAWIESTFTTYRSSMKGVDWGSLYNAYKDAELNPVKIEAEVEKLLDDDEVQRESGIYPYVLTRKAKHLNLRAFDDRMKRRIYRKQEGICAICEKEFEIDKMEADHKRPWSEGGKTEEANCQMLCRKCNREKSSK